MAVDITQLPDYGEKYGGYARSRRQAEAEEDTAKVAQLDAQWAQDQLELTNRAYAAREQQRELDLARQAAAVKYPDVKPELYSDATDPAVIDQRAAAIQAAIDEKKAPAAAGQEGAEGAASWGQGPPTGAAAAPPQQPELTRDQEMDQLRGPVLTQGRKKLAENRRLQELSIEPWKQTIMQRAAQPTRSQ